MRDEEFSQLSLILEQEFGISRTYFNKERLSKKLEMRLRELHFDSFSDYLEYFRRKGTFWREHSFLPAYILNMESFFLREKPQFRLFSELLAGLIARKSRSAGQTVRILSAGCAAGQEAYSMAIAIRESGIVLDGWAPQIIGVDVDSESIKKAEHGIYNSYALRGVGSNVIDRYFQQIGRDFFRLKPDILGTVAFRQANLLHPIPFVEPGAFDIIFLRNVLMYMSDDAADHITRNLWTCLKGSGYLFLGQSEILHGPDRLFEPVKYPDVTVYRKKAV